jgi:beta-glucosidase-like glycosyl hydrolase
MRPPAARAALLLGLLVAGLLPGCTAGGGRPGPSGPTGAASTPAPASGTTAGPPPATPGTTATPPGTTAGVPAGSPQARADAALARMDRQARIAQLFVVGVPLSDLASGDALARSGVGGLFLSGRSTASATALGAVTARWAAAAPGPRPWVAADQEGGQVQTLSGPGFARLPTATAQGALPAAQLGVLAHSMGRSLHTAGVTLDLAPVADVVPAGTAATNGPIGVFARQYGSTPAAVGAAAGTVVAGLADAGVQATVKHFPGLGRVTGNTDTTATVVDGTTTADDPQVALFGTLAREPAVPFVMVSLATYPRIDPGAPAAFSPAVLTTLLRQRLGYDGVVISDDLGRAKAVAAVPAGERAVRFLAAGGTLVLTVDAAVLPAMESAVAAAADADPALAARVDAAARTALLAKARAGLLGG